jgi:hypothetical protein
MSVWASRFRRPHPAYDAIRCLRHTVAVIVVLLAAEPLTAVVTRSYLGVISFLLGSCDFAEIRQRGREKPPPDPQFRSSRRPRRSSAPCGRRFRQFSANRRIAGGASKGVLALQTTGSCGTPCQLEAREARHRRREQLVQRRSFRSCPLLAKTGQHKAGASRQPWEPPSSSSNPFLAALDVLKSLQATMRVGHAVRVLGWSQRPAMTLRYMPANFSTATSGP